MERLYILATADEFEFPVYIERSYRVLSRVSGYSVSCLKMAFSRGSLIDGKYKIFCCDTEKVVTF